VATPSREDPALGALAAEPLVVSLAAQAFLAEELRSLRRARGAARNAPPSSFESLSEGARTGYMFLKALPNEWAPFRILDRDAPLPGDLRQLLASMQAEWRKWVAKTRTNASMVVTELSAYLLGLPAATDRLQWLIGQQAVFVVVESLEGAIHRSLDPSGEWLGGAIRTANASVSLDAGHEIHCEVKRVTLHANDFVLRTLVRIPMDLLGETREIAHGLSWAGFDEATDDAGNYYLLQIRMMEGSIRGRFHIHEIEQVAFPPVDARAESVTVAARSSRLSWISGAVGGAITSHLGAMAMESLVGMLHVGDGTTAVQEGQLWLVCCFVGSGRTSTLTSPPRDVRFRSSSTGADNWTTLMAVPELVLLRWWSPRERAARSLCRITCCPDLGCPSGRRWWRGSDAVHGNLWSSSHGEAALLVDPCPPSADGEPSVRGGGRSSAQ